MISFLAIMYGLHVTLLLYFVSYISAKGILGGGSVFSGVIVVGKFLAYWKMITFGFAHFPAWGILCGMIGSIYVSLPILYWVDRFYQASLGETPIAEKAERPQVSSSAIVSI